MKKLFSIALTIFVIYLVFNFWNDEVAPPDNSHKSLDDLLTHFSTEFTVSDIQKYHPNMSFDIDPSAIIAGRIVKLDGESVELYKMDINNDNAKDFLKYIKSNKKITVLPPWGRIPIPNIPFELTTEKAAFVNGSFVLLDDDHPHKYKVREVFQKF